MSICSPSLLIVSVLLLDLQLRAQSPSTSGPRLTSVTQSPADLKLVIDLYRSLQSDPGKTCLEWLGRGKSINEYADLKEKDDVEAAKGFIDKLLDPRAKLLAIADIYPVEIAALHGTSALAAQNGIHAAIVFSRIGPFFRTSGFLPFLPSLAKHLQISPGTPQARRMIAVHELMHSIQAPEEEAGDYRNPALSQQNDLLVIKHCESFVRGPAGAVRR